jgi:hypothetical protein
MNPATKSEELFKKYCRDQSYQTEKILEGAEKTPDFKVTTPQGQIIAEIKEVCPNDEDIKDASGNGGTRVKILGKRVGEKIKQGTRKKYPDHEIPRVIVLYDNIVVSGIRPMYPNFFLSPADIAFGMYGELTTTILYDKAAGKILGTRNELGKNQHLRMERSQEASAVCLLTDIFDENTPFLYTYHSVFAAHPLSRQIFCGPNDKHFRNPVKGSTFETSWIEF